MNANPDNQLTTPPASSSSDLLAAFGDKVLNDLLQGEWEPDWEWQQKTLEKAEKMGLIRICPVTPDADISQEYDFIWERVAAPNDQAHPTAAKTGLGGTENL